MVRKLVYGVGINDADYVTQIMETVEYVGGRQKQKLIWICPFYSVWRDMLRRCHSDSYQIKYPTYKGCSVFHEWFRFSNFKAWMEKQDYKGKQLDKDLLIRGNKVYSPLNCLFVSRKVNMFIIECKAVRGDQPIGVYYRKRGFDMVNERTKPYVARVSGYGTKHKVLGYFANPEEAHAAWLKAKLELAKELASEILAEGGDPRIAKALVERYENYKENI